jgi:type IV pilus assembly protein PilQ
MKTKNIIAILLVSLAFVFASAAQDNPPPTVAATVPAVEQAAATEPPTSTAEQTTSPTLPASAVEQPAMPTPAAPGATPNTVIPLVQFVDAPLTAVIENLARQAGMNYILDPKINYGQPGPDGKITPQPSISIRWENLTAEQALGALLANYELQLIEDSKTKIARIAPKDPALPDPLVTKVIQLKYASPSNVVSAVQSAFSDKRSKVVTDVRSSQLVVVATEKEITIVEELASKLDVPTKQVLIEARLIETSLNPKTAKGIDWSGTLQNQHFGFGNNMNNVGRYSHAISYTTNSAEGGWIKTDTYGDNKPLGTPGLLWDTAKGLNPATAFLDADGLSAVLSFLNTDSDAKVIATPRAVTLDNETANLSVTEARPIFKTTAGTQGSPGGSEVIYTNLGTILQVTPRVSANNYINLKVTPEVSTFVNTVSKTVSGQISEADVFAFRRIDTQVLIPSGNTLVLGGLVSDASTKGYTKVPIAGDIPIVGLAFRKESKERVQKNLLIFITPTIVQESDFQPTQTDFLKVKFHDPSQKPWSAWDSGKPAIDWTKLSGGTKDQ